MIVTYECKQVEEKERNIYYEKSINCFFITTIFVFLKNNYNISADAKTIVINEICAKNTTVENDDGAYYDWIELYNNSDEILDISGYGLSNDENKQFVYTFPQGTILQKNEYFIVFVIKRLQKW